MSELQADGYRTITDAITAQAGLFNNGSAGALTGGQAVDGGTSSSGWVQSQFNNGTASAANSTRVHGYPLPPEGRGFRPSYSRGQYALPHPLTGTDARFTRVTTGAHTLDSTTGLDKWKTGNVVLGLKDHPDLLEDIDLFAEPREVTQQVRRIAEKAQEYAGANQAAELGTAIHAWTEAVERDGVPLEDVPDQFRPYLTAYMNALETAGITTVDGMVERIVHHPASGWVGTLDRIYRLADGTHVIGDVKTSKTLRYGWLGFSVQFAAYADAAYMLRLDGSGWDPMPEVSPDYAVVAHVPSDNPGKCDLVTFDLHAGREYLDLAVRVHKARLEAERRVANQWPLPMPGQDLEDRVRACKSAEELSKLWEENADHWTPALTSLGMNTLTENGLI